MIAASCGLRNAVTAFKDKYRTSMHVLCMVALLSYRTLMLKLAPRWCADPGRGVRTYACDVCSKQAFDLDLQAVHRRSNRHSLYCQEVASNVMHLELTLPHVHEGANLLRGQQQSLQ
jgi:hypothetical protein